jgi:hypothetical protein
MSRPSPQTNKNVLTAGVSDGKSFPGRPEFHFPADLIGVLGTVPDPSGGEEIGWGGWTRTNTVLINSEVPYRLDHAPAASQQIVLSP